MKKPLGSEKNITFQERKTEEVAMPSLSDRMRRKKLSENKVSLSEVQTIKLSPRLSRYQV